MAFIKDNVFLKNLSKLLSGTVFAAILTIITMPFISRLYDPQEFGQFQLLLSIVSIFGVISSFKYELAIVLPKEKKASDSLFTLSILIMLVSTTISTLFLFIFWKYFLDITGIQALEPYLFIISLGLFLSSLVQITRYALLAKNDYYQLSINRVLESSTSQGLKIAGGSIEPTFLTLYYSQMSAYLLSFLVGFYYARPKILFSKRMLLYVAKKYIKFPIHSMPSVFVNTIAIQLPIFFIGKYYGVEALGFYVLALRMIDIPVVLIGGAIGQVYLKSASELYNTTNNICGLYKNVIIKLIVFGGGMFILIYIFSPLVVVLFLGSQWEETAIIMKILIFWKFSEFITSPVSMSLTIINKQEIDLFLKLALSLLPRLFILTYFNKEFYDQLFILSATSGLYYLVLNIIIYSVLKKEVKCSL